jgi:hypothetical protein
MIVHYDLKGVGSITDIYWSESLAVNILWLTCCVRKDALVWSGTLCTGRVRGVKVSLKVDRPHRVEVDPKCTLCCSTRPVSFMG